MATLSLIILTLGIFLDTAFIIYDSKKHGKASIFLKTVASLMFVLLSICNYRSGIEYLIIIALFLDLLGDFVLILRNVCPELKNKLYIIGTLLFFIAHIVLIIYLCLLNIDILIPSVVISIILFVLFGYRFISTLNAQGTLKKVGTLYLYIMLLTCILSVYLLVLETNVGNFVLMIGILIYTFSDFVLIIQKFRSNPKAYLQPLYRITYYVSQLIIALYILFT